MSGPDIDHAARAAEILARQDAGRYDVDEALVHAALAIEARLDDLNSGLAALLLEVRRVAEVLEWLTSKNGHLKVGVYKP